MSRGANKENLATNTIGQAAFWNSGKGEPSARLKISTPYETKLQNFLKKSSVDQKNKLQAFDFKIKDQSYSIDSAYNVYTAELTQHTRLDQKKQSLDPRNERHSAVPFADRTAFHVNQDKTRSVTPQPNRSSSSKKETNARSPAQNAMNQSSGYSGTPNQLKGKTQKLSNGPVTLHSQGFEQIPLGYQYSGSQTRPRSAQKLTRSSSTQQQQSLMRGIQSATNSRSTNTILLSQTPSVYISSNESNFGSNPSQNSNWSSQQESQGTRKSSTAGVSQQQMGSYEQINPLLHQFLEETHLKELIQMDIEEFRRHRTQNRELEAAVKQLTFELQNEKNKTTLLQNEIANLNGSMVEERSKYEAEIANMANQINQLKNVQNLYVGEKRTSELLENQLNAKEKKLQEITRFSSEVIETIRMMLHDLANKPEIAGNSDYCESVPRSEHETILETIQNIRKTLVAQLEAVGSFGNSDDSELISNTKRQLKEFSERKALMQASNEAKCAGTQGESNLMAKKKKNSLSKTQSELNFDINTNQMYFITGMSENTPNFAISKSVSDFRREREKRTELASEQEVYEDRPQKSKSDYWPSDKETQSKLREEKDNKYADEELFLSDTPLQYSFEQAAKSDNDKEEDKEDLSQFFDGFSKIQTQNLDASSMFFGKTGFNFNVSNNQSVAYGGTPDMMSQQASERKSTKPENIQNCTDKQHPSDVKTMKNYDMPLSHPKSFPSDKTPQEKTVSEDHAVEGGINRRFQQQSGIGQILEVSKEYTLNSTQQINHNEQGVVQTPSADCLQNNQDYHSHGTHSDNIDPSLNYTASHEKIQAPGNTNRNITEYESVQSNTTDSALGYEMAVAKFDYNAQRDNDLSFSKGDKIQILKREKNGWWIGLCMNKIGYFPYNFIQILDEGSY